MVLLKMGTDRGPIREQVKIVFVGEVDCGKSTLIGRLLYNTHSIAHQARQELLREARGVSGEISFAHLLDSFQEERLQEFTLDMTQAHLKLGKREYLLIDVPGHREFLRNMLTGASYADTAVVVLDATRGIEEQTRRHIYVLKFLGIDELVLAINKMDLVSYAKETFNKLKSSAETFLKEQGATAACIIPLSAKDGENLLEKSNRMPWYDGPCLGGLLGQFSPKKENYDFRFPIQDVYNLKGRRMAVGMVAGGSLRVKEWVGISPEGKQLRANKILSFKRRKLNAQAGESIGIIFDRGHNLRRGQVVYKGRPPKTAGRFQAKLFCLQELNLQGEFCIKLATQQASCRIAQVREVIDTTTLKDYRQTAGIIGRFNAAWVDITTQSSLAIERFQDLPALGRFVLEKDDVVLAAGIVV
jgi:small GTP-binding protein